MRKYAPLSPCSSEKCDVEGKQGSRSVAEEEGEEEEEEGMLKGVEGRKE